MFTGLLTFLLQNIAGDVGALGWWDLFINFGYSSCNYAVILTLVIAPFCGGAVNGEALKFHFEAFGAKENLFFSSSCSIAECFAFLVCTKWSNPVIHRNSHNREVSSSSTSIRYLDWNSGLVVSPEEDQHQDRVCGIQDVGGHIMKIPIIGFQVLLCMRLEVC